MDRKLRVGSRAVWLRVLLGACIAFNAGVLAKRIGDDVRTLRAPRYQDPVTRVDRAVIRMLPLLPARGTVGYLKTDYDRSNSADLATFFQIQYAVAPRVLVAGTTPDVVIAVGTDRQDLPPVPDGFMMTTALSEKLALYQRVR